MQTPIALTNTPVSEAQLGALIPSATPVANIDEHGIIDDASPVGAGDAEGHVQSVAFDLGNGLFLYAYQLECHAIPNWDVGFAEVGGLRVPMNGNEPFTVDFNNDGIAEETSFHTTEVGLRPFVGQLAVMNQGDDDFPVAEPDFTTNARLLARSSTPTASSSPATSSAS